LPSFFFSSRRRHTRWPRDWSSDVCSSDLPETSARSSLPERYLSGVRSRMEDLAEVSGGHIVYPKRLEDIVPLYQQIGRDVGNSYTLGYVSSQPEKDGSFRRIEVRATDQHFRLTQSRNGYYAK